MRVALLCHAPTDATRHARFAADEPVDAGGAARLLRRRPRLPPHGLCLAGPSRRAMDTARALGLDAAPEPALGDLDCGRWAGVGLDTIARDEPEAFAAWLNDPAAVPHGGESVLALIARVARWFDGLDGGSGRPGLLGVTHAAVIRAAILQALGAPPRSFWRIDVAPLALAEFTGQPGRWTLAALRPFA